MAKISALQEEVQKLRQRNSELEARLARTANAKDVTEKILAESSGRFHALFETMAQGVVYQDAHGTITLTNPAAERILGLSQEELLERTAVDLYRHATREDGSEFPAGERPAMLALHTGKPVNDVMIGFFNSQREEYRWVLVNAVPEFRADETKPYRVYTTLTDITALRQAEEALSQSEARYRLIAEHAADVIWVLDPVARKFTYVSPSVEKLRGYTPEEVMAQPLSEALTPKSAKMVSESLATTLPQLIAKGVGSELHVYEVDQPHKDGCIVHTEVTANYMFDEHGRVQVVGVTRDITERKRTEEALQEKLKLQEQLEKTASTVPGMLHTFKQDADGKFSMPYASPAIEGLYGLKAETVAQDARAIFELIDPQDIQHVEASIAKSARTMQPWQDEFRLHHPQKGLRWLEGRSTPVRAEDGGILWHGFLQDITERKENQKALAGSEQRLKTMIDSAMDAIITADNDLRVVLFNHAAEKMFDVPAEQALGQSLNQFIPQHFRGAHHHHMLGLTRRKVTQFPSGKTFSITGLRANGEEFPAESTFSVTDNAGEKLYTAILRDTTERNQAENEILRRQKLLEKVIQLGKNITAITDLDRCMKEIHQSVQLGLGFDRIGLFLYNAADNMVRGVYGTSRTGQMEDNSWYKLPVQDLADWQITLGSPSGIAVDDDYQASHHVKPENEMYGVKQHVTLAAWAGDRPVALITVDNLISQKPILPADLEALQLFAGYAGLAVENARLQTGLEQRVKERTAEVRDLYDNAPNGYHSIDRNGLFVMINQTELDWLGYTREDVVGRMKQTDILTPEGVHQFQEEFPVFIKQGRINDLEYDFVRKDGSLLPVILSAIAVYNDDGDYLFNRVTVFDNTGHKQADQRLRESEARLNFLIAKTPAVIFTTSLSRPPALTFVSKSIETVLGYTSEQVMANSETWLDYLHPDDLNSNTVTLQDLRKHDHGVWEGRIKHADGSYHWVSAGINLLRDSEGATLEVIGFAVDITDRKQVEAELQAQRDFAHQVMDALGQGLVVSDTQGQVEYANPYMARLVGHSQTELVGSTVIDLALPEDLPTIREHFSARLPEEESQYEFRLRTAYGQVKHMLITSTPRWRDGKVIGSIAVFTDLTETKEIEMRLRQSRDELSAANAALEKAARMKDEFLASMSHELRTPLTGILGLSEALQLRTYGELSEKQLKALKNIEGSGRHLLELINDILDLSKIEAGKLEMQFEPCSLADICQSSLQMIKGVAQQKEQTVSFTANPLATVIRADPRRLKQMLVNLLSNAVKFTPQGGALGLEVNGFPKEHVIRLTVWDAGIGIKAEDMPRLFQPFVQLDSSLARQQSGTGLGLSLVQRMTEMHGGSVQVESSPGEGSRFSIVLPWSPDNTQPLPRPKYNTGNLRHSITVEDSELDAEQITRYLRHIGIENIVLPMGRDAVEIVTRVKPGVILLDLHLPDGSGWEVLAALKADERTRDIPVVVTSVEEKRSKAASMGAAGYLVKPFSLNDLRSELSRVAETTARPEAIMTNAPRQSLPLVLVTDDNQTVLEALSDFLETQNLRVVTAYSGVETLDLAPELHPDILLLDIQMPGMDGLEVARTLRAHPDPAVATVPIIAVTALAMPGDRERCLAAGADAYVTKPVHLPDLVDLIQGLLQGT